jgi:metal-sulfur cluster biosynthetic enzyme
MIHESQVWLTLQDVIDPEIGCNVVDLGLIYDVRIDGDAVGVRMTLTTPGCPMGESLAEGARHALLALPGVSRVDVDIVWDPPWSPGMMTAAGRTAVSTR